MSPPRTDRSAAVCGQTVVSFPVSHIFVFIILPCCVQFNGGRRWLCFLRGCPVCSLWVLIPVFIKAEAVWSQQLKSWWHLFPQELWSWCGCSWWCLQKTAKAMCRGRGRQWRSLSSCKVWQIFCHCFSSASGSRRCCAHTCHPTGLWHHLLAFCCSENSG